MGQTAVEWLNEKIMDIDIDFECTLISKENYWVKRKELLEQANKMFEQQIIDTWDMGRFNIDAIGNGEEYYQETFKKD